MSIVKAITQTMWVASAFLLGACDDRERKVILERSPFFQETIPYDPKDTVRVISVVRRFADVNGMDFLIGGFTPDGDFNVTAAGHDMNFKAIHSSVIEPNTTTVWVYAMAQPSGPQQDRARAFACLVKGSCAQQ